MSSADPTMMTTNYDQQVLYKLLCGPDSDDLSRFKLVCDIDEIKWNNQSRGKLGNVYKALLYRNDSLRYVVYYGLNWSRIRGSCYVRIYNKETKVQWLHVYGSPLNPFRIPTWTWMRFVTQFEFVTSLNPYLLS
jgi:hypothetical protein